MTRRWIGLAVAVSLCTMALADMQAQMQEKISAGEKSVCRVSGKIVSLRIMPSVRKDGWIVYRTGARAIAEGRHLNSLEVFWFPTGTEVGNLPPEKAGAMKRTKTRRGVELWELALPDGVMSTNFWAAGLDSCGRPVRSSDLKSVVWDDRAVP